MTDILDLKDNDSDKKDKKRRERELSDLRKVLQLVEGRRLVWRILSQAGIYRSSLSDKPELMYASEGARDKGLWLLNEILIADHKSFIQMQNEAVSDTKSQKEKKDE